MSFYSYIINLRFCLHKKTLSIYAQRLFSCQSTLRKNLLISQGVF